MQEERKKLFQQFLRNIKYLRISDMRIEKKSMQAKNKTVKGKPASLSSRRR